MEIRILAAIALCIIAFILLCVILAIDIKERVQHKSRSPALEDEANISPDIDKEQN